MNKLYIIVLLSVIYNSCYSQNNNLESATYFFDLTTKEPIRDVSVKYFNTNDTVTYISDIKGAVNSDPKFRFLKVTHLNYKDTILINSATTFFLTPLNHNLQEVKIEKNKIKNNFGISVLKHLMDYSINFVYNDKAALYIPYEEQFASKNIQYLKYELVDILGVKNMKYLPFKANIYSVDTITMLPDTIIYKSKIIKKSDRKKWVIIDVASEKIQIPKEGVFIVFEVLDRADYKTEYVNSSQGQIPAVPTVRAKFHDAASKQKSYLLRTTGNIELIMEWESLDCDLQMEVEFEK